MEKLRIIVFGLAIIVLVTWFIIQFLGWYTEIQTRASLNNVTTYTYFSQGYNINMRVKGSSGDIVTNTYTKYSEDKSYTCSNCGSDLRCEGYCSLYSFFRSIYGFNYFILISIVGVFICQLLTFCLSKNLNPSKILFEIIYWFLILSMFVSGGILLIFLILSGTKWENVKDANAKTPQFLVDYSYGGFLVPFFGYINAVVLLGLFVIFCYDYYLYKRGIAAAVDYQRGMSAPAVVDYQRVC